MVVKPQEILAEEGGKISLAPFQRIGVRGAFIAGAVATAVLLILLARWIWLEPVVPNISAGMDEKQVAAIMSRYRELQTINIEGYVFGSQAGSKGS